MNQIASIGAMLIGVGMAIFLGNIIYSAGKGKPAEQEDPFGVGGKYYYPFEAKNPRH